MNLEQLKHKLEMHEKIEGPIIFLCKSPSFIAEQYVQAWGKQFEGGIESIDTLSALMGWKASLDSNTLYLYRGVDIIEKLPEISNLMVVAESVESSSVPSQSSIIPVPELQDWMRKDWFLSQVPEATPLQVNSFLQLDPFVEQSLLNKLQCMPPAEQSLRVDDLLQEALPPNLSYFVAGLFNKHLRPLPEIKRADVPQLIWLVYAKARLALCIVGSSSPATSKLNMSIQQFQENKKRLQRFFTENSLFHIVEELLKMEELLKQGKLDPLDVCPYIVGLFWEDTI